MFSVCLLICVIVLIGYKPAFGYIDPTTGSYFFQFLLAAILGGLVAVKMFWRRINAALVRLFGKHRESGDSDTD